MDFSNISELYKRVLPAINIKISDMKRHGFISIDNYDVFLYLASNKWNSSINLTLYDIVSDIFNVDEVSILNFSYNRKGDVVHDEG